ncbi:hypothetical protein [Flavivirga jejuensis]|uniref:Lipoprotein n=1 Tax=Flavivirga jejuensis TaxID=870487 RepID=A0ABT8WVK3_9FLAO|nr:hypothetical protein [Flavivirga jejuensis]MDO5977203.1 hypothetical protein [Flavivirga jejuensis]
MKKSKTLVFSSLILTISLFISCGSPIEVSPEMQGFITAISATKSMDESAEKYGYSADEIPLSYYDLGKATVTASNVDGTKTCYDLSVQHGLMNSIVIVCWENGKIVSVTDKEL